MVFVPGNNRKHCCNQAAYLVFPYLVWHCSRHMNTEFVIKFKDLELDSLFRNTRSCAFIKELFFIYLFTYSLYCRIIYKCSCETVFNKKRLLHQHFYQNTNSLLVSVFKCPECQLAYMQKQLLVQHLKVRNEYEMSVICMLSFVHIWVGGSVAYPIRYDRKNSTSCSTILPIKMLVITMEPVKQHYKLDKSIRGQCYP